ncbi:hypothetical protein DAKH74_048640 [Maudiozyma humilis]|uniref:ENTH domain-containing protein n=1 Tax=Maudiozyma humilis TaxID=51915 RepID=A0AAV5S3B4_MAUHU|nr:hypothetical protein DAKH74_048640 [Kazachstania humilis]
MSPYHKLIKGATKIKVAPPKDKYTVPLLNALQTEQDCYEIMQELRIRIGSNKQQWSIVFKSLVVIHMLVRENPRLSLQYLHDNGELFDNLQTRVYNTNNKWAAADLQVLKRYTEYLNCRAAEWPLCARYAQDRAPTNQQRLRYVQALERMTLQLMRNKYSQMDLETDLFLFTFRLLVADLLVLYNQLNEGVIRLLENFFDLGYADAETTLDLYKRFVDVTESVVQYLRVGKALGLDIPVIKHITTKLIRSLEDHLNDRRNYTDSYDATARNVSTSSQTNTREPARNVSTASHIRSPRTNTNSNAAGEDSAVAEKRRLAQQEEERNAAEQQRLARVQEEKRRLEAQLQLQQQIQLTSPATFSSSNPFSPQPDAFSFEQAQGQFQVQSPTGNPFAMPSPVQVAYTNSTGYAQAPPAYGSPAQPQTQTQTQSLAPARSTSMMLGGNPFAGAVGVQPTPTGMGTGMVTDPATGVTYVPVPVQLAAVVPQNPFQEDVAAQQAQAQAQQAQAQGHVLRNDSSLLDL